MGTENNAQHYILKPYFDVDFLSLSVIPFKPFYFHFGPYLALSPGLRPARRGAAQTCTLPESTAADARGHDAWLLCVCALLGAVVKEGGGGSIALLGGLEKKSEFWARAMIALRSLCT